MDLLSIFWLLASALAATAIGLCAHHSYHTRFLVPSVLCLTLFQILFFGVVRALAHRFRRGCRTALIVVLAAVLLVFARICFRPPDEYSSIELASVSIPSGAPLPPDSVNKIVLRLGTIDVLPGGPLSFDIDTEGNTYISDFEGYKVLVFDSKGVASKSYPLLFKPGRIRIREGGAMSLEDAVTGANYRLDASGQVSHGSIRTDERAFTENQRPQLKISGLDSFFACHGGIAISNDCLYKFRYSGKELVSLSFLGTVLNGHRVCFDLQVAQHNRPDTVLRFVVVYDQDRSVTKTIGPLFNDYDYPLTDDVRVTSTRLYQLKPTPGETRVDSWSLD
jgi:hypothetical protein